MPHYRDGTPAAIGDVVRGKGYNVKGPDGNLAEITGVVVHIAEGATTCNVQIARVVIEKTPADFRWPDHKFFVQRPEIHFAGPGQDHTVRLDIEYGQCDHFEKIA